MRFLLGEVLAAGAPTLKIQDNGGATTDRFTITIDDDVYYMSHNAHMPDGVNQHCGVVGGIPHCLDPEIHVLDTPPGVCRAILERMER